MFLGQLNLAERVNTNEAQKIVELTTKNYEYKTKLFRLLRSIVERVLIDAYQTCDQVTNQQQTLHQQQQQQSQQQTQTSTLQQQQQFDEQSASSNGLLNPNNPTTRLWAEVRNRGCQFLGPQMQDDVLRIILLALDTYTRMSRKVLVLYVVHRLKKHYPKASKTSVGHVVQLLYRTGCFKMEKRDNDSSLMELKKEYSKYPALRRQHDSQIIQIALESGIRMSPEQWSHKLFGDASHKSEMQSIIDTLQSQLTLEKLISDFYEKMNSALDPQQADIMLLTRLSGIMAQIRADFDFFAAVNFEKKQAPPVQSATNSGLMALSSAQRHALFLKKKARLNGNGLLKDQDDMCATLNNIGSGGESTMGSEDSYDILQDYDEEFFDEDAGFLFDNNNNDLNGADDGDDDLDFDCDSIFGQKQRARWIKEFFFVLFCFVWIRFGQWVHIDFSHIVILNKTKLRTNTTHECYLSGSFPILIKNILILSKLPRWLIWYKIEFKCRKWELHLEKKEMLAVYKLTWYDNYELG